MRGQVSAGKAKYLLNKPVGDPVRFRYGDQHGHDSQPGGLVNSLVENDAVVVHRTPLFLIQSAPRLATVSVAAADTTSATSPAALFLPARYSIAVLPSMPATTKTPHRSSIVAVAAKCKELRTSSIVA